MARSRRTTRRATTSRRRTNYTRRSYSRRTTRRASVRRGGGQTIRLVIQHQTAPAAPMVMSPEGATLAPAGVPRRARF